VASRLNPYLSFDGDAKAAMEFYRTVFGGELALNTFGDLAGDAPNGDKIMHAMLDTSSGFTLMGADNPPHEEYKPGNTMSVSLSGDDVDELRGYWDLLSTGGGTIAVPLEKQMWGDEFGMCTDRFGVTWLVNVTAPVVAAT